MNDTTPHEPADDDLRRHSETAAEGPTDGQEPDGEADQLRQHAEAPTEG